MHLLAAAAAALGLDLLRVDMDMEIMRILGPKRERFGVNYILFVSWTYIYILSTSAVAETWKTKSEEMDKIKNHQPMENKNDPQNYPE